MRPLFTIHAGEYLVGSYIEEKFKTLNVWVPSKDTGTDLLVTEKLNRKSVSLQVKFSKDFLVTHMSNTFQRGLKACGWWSLNHDKIELSKADFWVFVLHSFNQRILQFIIIRPAELLKALTAIHGRPKTFQSYIWVTKKNRCWETRGLKKADQILIANNAFKNPDRDLTRHLNNWQVIRDKLK